MSARSILLGAGLMLGCVSCASRPGEHSWESAMPHQYPGWLNDALASTTLGGIDPGIVEAASRDPNYVEAIRSAVHVGNEHEAFNLSYLLLGLDARSMRPEHLTLARWMYAADPEHHAATLAAISWCRPLEECEGELLRMAFDPRGRDVSRAWGFARERAAQFLVTRLAFDAPSLPRAAPLGAPAMIPARDPQIECFHRALRIAYGVDVHEAEFAAFEHGLTADPDRWSASDHETNDCLTVVARVRERR
ncbi:MAG: hypothetical protein AB7G11_10595 [Phycisphaerales bacterium]